MCLYCLSGWGRWRVGFGFYIVDMYWREDLGVISIYTVEIFRG